MTNVYIIRHAEADGNLYRRIHGHYDGLVTPDGLRQIAALRNRFSDIHVDAVYTSDLFRARKTAEAIASPKGLPLQMRRELREINLGAWEDRTWGEAAHYDTERLHAFSFTPWDFAAQGGESMPEFADRIYRVVTQIACENDGGTIAVVTHGMAIRALMCRLAGLPLKKMNEIDHCDNTSVALVSFDGDKAEIIFRNDNSHLDEKISTFAKQKWWRSPDVTGVREMARLDANMWFAPVDVDKERERVEAFRRDAWITIHKTLKVYDPEFHLNEAARMAAAHPRAVAFAMLGDEVAGIIQLDVNHPAEPDCGHAAFVYLREQYRGRGLAAQLIGHAVSVYRELGRTHLRLRAAYNNEIAFRFYEKIGFVRTDEEQGMTGLLYIYKKPISEQYIK